MTEDLLDQTKREKAKRWLVEQGLGREIAQVLVETRYAEVVRQFHYWPYQNLSDVTNRGGFLRRAIEQGYGPPSAFTKARTEAKSKTAHASTSNTGRSQMGVAQMGQVSPPKEETLDSVQAERMWRTLSKPEQDELLEEAKQFVPAPLRKKGKRLAPSLIRGQIARLLYQRSQNHAST